MIKKIDSLVNLTLNTIKSFASIKFNIKLLNTCIVNSYYKFNKNYEKEFLNYFKKQQLDFLPVEKFYTVFKALDHIRLNKLNGSIVEIGAYKGRMGHLICQYLDKHTMKNKIYFYDTFEGMTIGTKFDYNLIDKKKYTLKEGETLIP